MMGKRAKINYLVDLLMLVMFVVSALSGLGLMHPADEHPNTIAPSQGRTLIATVHIASSFLMVAGVALHLALHATWLWRMTNTLAHRRQSARPAGYAREINIVT
jgi:hypothetical protein